VRAAEPADADSIADAQVWGWRVGSRGLFPDEFLDADEFDTVRRHRWKSWTWREWGGPLSQLYVGIVDSRDRSGQARRSSCRYLNSMELLPNSMSFKVVATLDVSDEAEVPDNFTGRVRLHARGRLMYQAWYRDGKLDNPARNEPAFRRYRSNGGVRYELWYLNGNLHDPSRSRPAVRGYFGNGVVHYEERYRNGRRHDGTNGEAAIRKFRQDGTLRHELRYRDGARVLTPASASTSAAPMTLAHS
jgi:hypothetical protein